ncbi:MAG: tyrosine--tRNA ligase [Deltaproteobacteria bacterium]|nr:MAG: tyrosine--tRNA ligase [Deltaproteobacteria bacterium]
MENLLAILRERGFIEQTTHTEELQDLFNSGQVTCYIGFDPTAPSLHIGSLVPIMSLAYMQRHGHRPIALVGSGTGLVGDPSGKTEMRQLLTLEKLEENAQGIKKQLSRFLDFSDQKALMLNNADWLTKLEYIPFLRDIGRHFSVNRMIKAESYKLRLESDEGLSFIEFNYMLLQAYDFLELFDNYGCRLQMGGSDQWGNIVAGIELIRRVKQASAYGITFPLIGTSSGEKMGKTAKGAVWLDPDLTTPYEYYQYWINTDDRDVERFLALFTFLPMSEITKIAELQGADLNSAKTVLAYETTALAHGEKSAEEAYLKSISNFGVREVPRQVLASSTIHQSGSLQIVSPRPGDNQSAIDIEEPDSYINKSELKLGIPAFKLFHSVGLTASSSDARRLIEQGGAYLNARRIRSFDQLITDQDLDAENMIVLRSGKKRFYKIKVK